MNDRNHPGRNEVVSDVLIFVSIVVAVFALS